MPLPWEAYHAAGMPQKKNIKKPYLRALGKVGQVLVAIGLPCLFASKIFLWTAVWLGNFSVRVVRAVFYLLSDTLKSLWWLIFIALRTGLKLSALVQEKTNSAQTTVVKLFFETKLFLNIILRRLLNSVKNISLPKVAVPKITPPKKRFTVPTLRSLPPVKSMALGFLACFLFLFIPYWTKTQIDQLPNPSLLTTRDISVSTKIYDRNGALLYQIYADENSSIVNLSDLPKYVALAHIAIEDKHFDRHLGFDPGGIIRAAFANAQGQSTQGGSTITQQLIKSALLSPERTIDRKVKEIILAFWTERMYGKDQILTMYLNQVPYGGAAYGIESAAQTYFGKSAKNLTLAEAALLAGLPSAPTVYSPFGTHPELAKQRQVQVLNAMQDQGYITSLQKDAALSEKLVYSPIATSIKAPHFVMYVRDYLIQKYGIRTVEQGGLEVTTTLDLPTYEASLQMLKDGVDAQRNLNVGNGAVLITDPKKGEILSMVGSVDFFDTTHDGNVNVTLAQRSPGSSIKPLNYALAMDKNLITPSTVINDTATVWRSGTTSYAPQNYDNKFHGPVTVRTALASSYNIPAVKVLEKNGVTNFIDFAKKAGISTFTDPSRYGLSLTLGGGEVTALDMATAYSIFPNDGTRVDLHPTLLVKDFKGRILEDHRDGTNLTTSNVIGSRTAFLISNILADNGARSPAFGPSSALVIPNHTVSVKTGTAQDKRDNWTIGYTPSYLVAVWVGNNDNSPMSPYLESGNTGAAAIWNPIMSYLLKDKPDEGIMRPDDVIAVQICSLNGLLPCENCPSVRTEYFTRGTEPKVACNFTKEEVDKILHPEEKKN